MPVRYFRDRECGDRFVGRVVIAADGSPLRYETWDPEAGAWVPGAPWLSLGIRLDPAEVEARGIPLDPPSDA